MKRFGSATWNGDLREGKGSVSTESRALESHPYTFFSRYGEEAGHEPGGTAGRRSCRMFHHVIRENARNGEVRAGAIGEQIGSGHGGHAPNRLDREKRVSTSGQFC